MVHDTDVNPDQERAEVDEQIIAFVVTVPCPNFLCCPACSGDGHDIRFERTEEPDIAAKYLRLCVTEMVTPESGGEPYAIYRPLITRDDQYIYVRRDVADQAADAINQLIGNN
jgi:hypothetical protein